MPSTGSVTRCIAGVRVGDEKAAQELWERYFDRLVRLARKKLNAMGARLRDFDEEDVALSALKSFVIRARDGGFPKLTDRDNLWPLLVVITVRKGIDKVVHQNTLKQGGGKVRSDSVLQTRGADSGDAGFDCLIGQDPTPEFIVTMEEQCERLLEKLDDDTLRKLALLKLAGYTDREAADELGVARATVARKLERIRDKWGSEVVP